MNGVSVPGLVLIEANGLPSAAFNPVIEAPSRVSLNSLLPVTGGKFFIEVYLIE